MRWTGGDGAGGCDAGVRAWVRPGALRWTLSWPAVAHAGPEPAGVETGAQKCQKGRIVERWHRRGASARRSDGVSG